MANSRASTKGGGTSGGKAGAGKAAMKKAAADASPKATAPSPVKPVSSKSATPKKAARRSTRGKRAGRATTEGLVGFILEDRDASIVGIGCETEPVSNNEEFQAFATKVLRAVHAEGPDAAESFEDERVELVAKLGENIVIVSPTRFEAPEGDVLGAYAHPPANKIGVLVELQGGTFDGIRHVDGWVPQRLVTATGPNPLPR